MSAGNLDFQPTKDPTASTIDVAPHSHANNATYSTISILGSIQIAGAGSPTGTSAQWKPLELYNGLSSATTSFATTTWQTVPVAALAGLTRNSLNDWFTTAANRAPSQSVGTSDWPLFLYHKLKGFKITFKNFQILVERTNAGGIQFQNPHTIEIATFPEIDGFVATNYPTAEVPSSFLSNVYSVEMSGSFTRSYECVNPTYYSTNKFISFPAITAYQSVYNLVTPHFRVGTTTGEPMRPWYDITSPLETFFVRVRTIPPGITNVQIDLKYTAELTGIWENHTSIVVNPLFYYVNGLANIPTQGDSLAVQSNSLTKRKFKEEESDII